MKITVALAMLVFGSSAWAARIQIQDISTGKWVNLTSSKVTRVEFNFPYGAHPGMPAVHCAFTASKGLQILRQVGFKKPEKQSGIPACVNTGNLSLYFAEEEKPRMFEILCDELIRDPQNNAYYRLLKNLNYKVCEGR